MRCCCCCDDVGVVEGRDDGSMLGVSVVVMEDGE